MKRKIKQIKMDEKNKISNNVVMEFLKRKKCFNSILDRMIWYV